MSRSRKLVLGIYAALLTFYPRNFRERFADEMLAAAKSEAQRCGSSFRLFTSLFADVFRSLPRAYWYHPPKLSFFPFAVVTIAFVIPSIFLTLSNQRSLRRLADYMPGELTRQYAQATTARTCATYAPGCTTWYAQRLSAMHSQEIESAAWQHSGLAFIAIYDDSGHVLGSNATLHGQLPQPPQGIFTTIRQRGEFRVTWQPQPGLRVALTGRTLPSGGFVLSGDSLAQADAGQRRLLRDIFPSWRVLLWYAVCLILPILARLRSRQLRSTAV